MVNAPSIVVNNEQGQQLRLSDFVPLATLQNMQEDNAMTVHVVLKKDGTSTYKGSGSVLYEEGSGTLQVSADDDDDELVAYVDDNEYAGNAYAENGYMFFKTAAVQAGGARKARKARKTRKGRKGCRHTRRRR